MNFSILTNYAECISEQKWLKNANISSHTACALDTLLYANDSSRLCFGFNINYGVPVMYLTGTYRPDLTRYI